MYLTLSLLRCVFMENKNNNLPLQLRLMLYCFLADVAKRPEGTYIVQHPLPRFRQDKTLTVPGWTVPQLSIMIIYNSTWSVSIQQIRIKLSGDNLTQKTQKKDPFTSLHKIKVNLPLWAEFKILRNGAFCAVPVHARSADGINISFFHFSKLCFYTPVGTFCRILLCCSLSVCLSMWHRKVLLLINFKLISPR